MIPFNTRRSAAEYTLLSDGYDGRAVVEVLNGYLRPGASVLELGMGPGRDIPLLEEKFKVTGSDISGVWIDMYREKHPDADLLVLDAVTLETDRKFDCIYSNKVLHYLSPEQLRKSLQRQLDLLNPGGCLCHAVWNGDKSIDVKGMTFQYYTEKTFLQGLDACIAIQWASTYREMDMDDSLLLVLRPVDHGC